MSVPLVLAGCSSSGGATTSSGELSGSISVYAAASLTEAFKTIEQQFTAAHPGTSVTLTFGASSDLSTQISQGAKVDVFASASEKNMKALASQATSPTDFVKNRLEIAVPPNNPAHITSVADLARSGVKVAVCDPAVPCGVVAQQVFTNAKITVKPTANEADVKSTLAAVESGEVDAGLVYVTDVRAAGSKVTGIPIPGGVNASTTYPIATLKGAPNPALAKAFVDYVLSADGRKVLTADGFAQP
ncbi:MAG: molybdate ABC transporter substrate-binding protein [Jatrophihabitans sp.]|uniref:molybdate ABC transporter substrate-binding protein n=1 Tax=Jatrophihabitans sp. TaxID=1932789 RepID=UPI003F81F286